MTEQRLSSIDDGLFRNVVGHFMTGVTIITAADGPRLFGSTASAVSSLSVDPPMMLVCLNRSSATHDAVASTGAYGISILSAEQGHLASQFARKTEDKFAGAPHRIAENGVPLIEGALATLLCTVKETAVGGTHTVFLGEVIEAEATSGEPLAYYRGTFGRLERGEEKAAYDATRNWVLQRRTRLGEVLDASEIAATLAIDPVLVHGALITLTAESLVSRGDDGHFYPTPIDEALIDNLFDARIPIETGVIETYFNAATEKDKADLGSIGERLLSIKSLSFDDLDDFLALNLEYHCRLVGLARSVQLTETYRKLSVSTVWRETFNVEDWRRLLSSPLLAEIVEAVDIGTAEQVKDAVRSHTLFVKQAAKDVVHARGGAV